jgi:hypothetical protein
MTIKHKKTFADSKAAGFDGVFFWDFLKGAFGPTIEPMDFDGVVERRGAFLVFETKAPGVTLPEGQRITLEALIQDPRFTVVLCAKRPEDIGGWEVWHKYGRAVIPGDAAALRAWCAAWYDYVNGTA